MSLPTLKLKNYTGHSLLDLTTGITYPTSNSVARVGYHPIPVAYSEEHSPIYKFTWNEIVGLPEPEEGLMCVVSGPVFNAIKAVCDNDGVRYPKCCVVHNTQFDAQGRPYGCHGFKING